MSEIIAYCFSITAYWLLNFLFLQIKMDIVFAKILHLHKISDCHKSGLRMNTKKFESFNFFLPFETIQFSWQRKTFWTLGIHNNHLENRYRKVTTNLLYYQYMTITVLSLLMRYLELKTWNNIIYCFKPWITCILNTAFIK